jgi:hypothetical protein
MTYLSYGDSPAELYEELTGPELIGLIQYVADSLRSGKNEAVLRIAGKLAAFTDADIAEIQEALLTIHEYYPGYIFRNATPGTARKLIDRIGAAANHHDTLKLNHILVALAWAGTEDVVRQFAHWREQPPEWRSLLYIAPERYAQCAGWELDDRSRMRKLILGKCYPLIRSERQSDSGPVTTCVELGQPCKWCGAPLTSLFAFDLTHELLDLIPFQGRRLTIATCEVCTSYGDGLYMKVGPAGEAVWYAGNVRPKYLPEDGNTWERPPANTLALSPKPRSLRHAAYGASSQIGGAPGWIDDAAHGQCPGCSKGLVFVAQLAAEDVRLGEGVFYALMCPDCSITTVRYQQT